MQLQPQHQPSVKHIHDMEVVHSPHLMYLNDKIRNPEMACSLLVGTDGPVLLRAGTFLLYVVSQHPGVEAKIIEELDSLELSITPERPHPRPLTYADLGRLTYLQAVVKVLLMPVSAHQANQQMWTNMV